MNKIFTAALLVAIGASPALTQSPSVNESPLLRRYHEGETLMYHMKGTNEGSHYEIQADGIVKKDAATHYFEEFRWSNLVSDGQKLPLAAASVDFRQEVSLDPSRAPALPDLARVDPKLIGPITDFLTFYVDLWLAIKTGKLIHTGDHFYFKRGTPNSWADGRHILTAEESIDFDLTLQDVSRSNDTATLLVRHVPPEKPEIKLAAEWMGKPVADTPNNWFEVKKMGAGTFLAAVGKETFDVQMKISLADGKILSGTLDNPLATIERECEDATLTKCGDPRPHPIRRHIEISLQP